MSSNPSKHPLPPPGTKPGPPDSRDQSAYSYLSTEVEGSSQGNRPSGPWNNDTEAHVNSLRNAELLSGQQNSSTSIHSVHIGSGHQAPSSAFAVSNSGQNSSARGPIYAGGQSQGIFGANPSNQTKVESLQHRTSFDMGSESRNAAFSKGMTGKSLPQSSGPDKTATSKHPSLPASDTLPPAVTSVPRGGMIIHGGNPPSGIRRANSPQGASRPAPQPVMVEPKPSSSARQGINSTTSVMGPLGSDGKTRDVYSNSPVVQHAATQKLKPNENSFANIQRQTSGQPQRFAQNPPGNPPTTNMPVQLSRPNANSNSSKVSGPGGHDKNKRSPPSDPPLSYEPHPPGTQRPGMPVNTPGPFVPHGNVATSHPQMQLHGNSRRPLPMTGSQPARMAAPARATYPAPAQLRPTPNTGGMMRELRVEDALIYLDDVKREFKDRPGIYNEFLAIMKNFKSQEVDTPGVIARVSKLFQGYNSLILGFNTFLPEGYKISMADLERQEADRALLATTERAKEKPWKQATKRAAGPKPRKLAPSSTGPVTLPHVSAPPQFMTPQTMTPQTMNPQTMNPQTMNPQNMNPQNMNPQNMNPQNMNPQNMNPQAMNPQAMNPQNMNPQAMNPQAMNPQAMNTQAMNTQTMSPQTKLPQNMTPLPQQHQVPPVRQPPLPTARGRSPEESIPRQSPQIPQMIPNHLPQQATARPSPQAPQAQRPHSTANQSNIPPPRPVVPVPTQGKPSGVQAVQPQQQHQAVEFDHAISYVTKIKKRFANDPGTYHSFLEILHTYQKEQRGIKEVLEQVAHLFQDHPDLLKEFTFFLPDAVQEQAKERLHRAAAESESRQAAQKQQLLEQQSQNVVGPGAQSQQNLIDMTRRGLPQAEADPRGRKRQIDGQPIPILTQPEMCVYNSAVERQFFDSAREALSSFSRDGGQAWSEFLKCLDMYAQEILSRSEMLDFVEPLLGKRNNNLFEEFKRILTAAGAASGSAALIEDSWYSVPLADIDFSRCRRCTPSYRALPRDYPAHPCSERSESESRVLNDIWVSLPVGSEESYTFRHMRRNTYEESLFRVEDERFEIDMAIDSNMATLYRLEPIAEEIAQLCRVDVHPTDLGSKNSSNGLGVGGKRFQYTFDKSVLGIIHRNAIVRIYGESGKEMLDLLEKNPTVAVPLVLSRLRQKQTEWVKVRTRLNRHWKELAEQNYYKSLDHRSLTWRTIDKRAISTRTLIAEIKDRAVNGGREGKEAYRQKLDKAKEEHGTFYEVTVGSKLDQDLDLTYLPKPDRRIFTPHQSILYTNVSWAQRDAYRILAFALERGQISPADKERCHRLWVEFLGPWFGLSLSWMQKPAAVYQDTMSMSQTTAHDIETTIISEDDDESANDDTNRSKKEGGTRASSPKEVSDHHPLPAGAYVSTLYGEGKILEFRRLDLIYKVRLGFGAVSFLRPSSVLCSMLPVENSASTRQLRAEDKTKLARPHDQLVFGTQSLYLFFRLHQLLIQRLNIAKRLAFSVGEKLNLQSLVERIPSSNPKTVGKIRYEAYLSLLYSLLDGGMSVTADGGKYEDRVRSLLGHGAYELATMDKLISHIWKDVQTMTSDENMWNLVQLYRRHMVTGSFHPEAFRQEAAYISEGEPLYAFQHCPMHGSDESVLHVEYVGILDDEDDDPMDEVLDGTAIPLNKRTKK